MAMLMYAPITVGIVATMVTFGGRNGALTNQRMLQIGGGRSATYV